MAHFDLSHALAKYLDRHLVFPLLEFLSHKQMYDENDIQKGKIDLLEKTNMVDFAMDIYKHLHNKDDVPKEMKERRTTVVGKLKTLQVLKSNV
jgi:translation initiation factor 3 subunit E